MHETHPLADHSGNRDLAGEMIIGLNEPLAEPHWNRTGAPRSPHLPRLAVGRTRAEKDGRPGFPATRHSPTTMCAAFSKESRMRFANATKLYRKSGGSPRKLLARSSRKSNFTSSKVPCQGLILNGRFSRRLFSP
jgi:hypothetical protein